MDGCELKIVIPASMRESLKMGETATIIQKVQRGIETKKKKKKKPISSPSKNTISDG